MTIKERFLKYVSYDTQSDDQSGLHPSTSKQFALAKAVVEELHELGVDNAYVDEYCYVYGFIPSNTKSNKTIGLIAHFDTALEASGKDIKPQVIASYDGLPITLNEKYGIVLDPENFPHLKEQIGHELITTDGTTLLGADDKAGIAVIMDYVSKINDTLHPNVIVTFTPDEEIGGGTDKFNFDYYKEHNCSLAYTLDGAEPNIINFENFNAAGAYVTVHGKSIHPGSAKNKMLNSIHLAMEFHSMLPVNMIPACTEKYEGFNHLNNFDGSVETTKLHYIIRNHNMDLFKAQKSEFERIVKYLNEKYGNGTFELTIKDSYFNMSEIVKKHPESLDYIVEALKECGLTPEFEPIRGGTDGARLSFEGITTPNIGNGGANFHGPYEYVDVDEMKQMVKVVAKLLEIATK